MESNENTLEELLAKRHKLVDLRNKLTSQGLMMQAADSRGESNPVTPYSIAQPSISPPPFSPLTPLIATNRENDDVQLLQDERNSGILLSEIPNNFSPSLLSTTINNGGVPLFIPLRAMTPETQQIFNILTECGTLNDNIVDEPADCDSDDSVVDPNYILPSLPTHIDESNTSCSSVDGNDNNEMTENINNLATNENLINNENPTLVSEDIIEYTGRPKRGRKRVNPQLRAERKYNKYNNLEYTTYKNKKIPPKAFKDYQCTCIKNCASVVPIEKRKEEFIKFVQLGSFNAQCLYIGSCVKEENKKRSYTMTNVPIERKKPRQFARVYSLSGIKVCRGMFLNTLQITTQKVTIALKKIRGGGPILDARGLNCNRRKLSDEDFNFIVETISKLPKYESHYRRERNSDALYLQSGMTLAKIYQIYQHEFTERYGAERQCASFASLKHIFYSKFNLKCKPLKKDTCNKCDAFTVIIQNARNLEEKERAQKEKTEHIEKAENMRNRMNADFQEARNSTTVECLTFDLEKTLPLPRIPTNIVFYKRQLWVYNSGIHSASDDIGHCYVWVEGEAGRGAQEVGSCLINFIKNKLRPTVEHLILWSDCCGGQNRNIKLVLMLKAILSSHPTLQDISMRFLESGHTFLPNDTDFSKIETALKHQQRIYTAEEYIDIMEKCKKQKPLKVQRMLKTDFYSCAKVEKNITNRKKFTDKSKVNWLMTKEIKIQKDDIYSIYMRTSFDEDFKALNIQKKFKGEVQKITDSDLILLWPDGKPIAPAKLIDLQSMYQYIPEYCLNFYRSLKSSDDILDDVDGFGGEPDFEIEEDE